MTWIVATADFAGKPCWSVYESEPRVKHGRIQRNDEQGPRVLQGPFEVEPQFEGLPINVLARIYGA